MTQIMQKVLVVADVSNLFYCIGKRFEKRLNYQAFLQKAVGDRFLYRAIAYGAEFNNEAYSFKQALKYFGYEVKYKQPKVYPTEDPEKVHRKADWDVGMAIDVIEILPSVDVVVLGTADGDLAPLVNHIRSRGKICEVLASGISRDLKDAANYFEEIDMKLLESSNEVSGLY